MRKDKKMGTVPIFVLMTWVLFVGNFLFSQEITIKANYKEQTRERIFAQGNVEIHYKNVILFADRVELDPETKDVFAEGNVVLRMPDEVVSVEEIRVNLDTMQGTLQKGYGMIQPSVYWEAETIERKNDNVYSLSKAKVTSCTQRVPRWKLSSYKANFKRNDYIEMWHTLLTIKKIPVFYLPYMRYPLDKEKSTGFLTPQLGFSGRKGLIFGQSFYWAIKRNMDATLSMDYYSARGMGGGLEYRYLFSGGTNGQLNLYYFRFKEDQRQEDSSKAYIIRLNHTQRMPYNFTMVADIDYQSSFAFLREFDNNFRRAIVSQRRSQVYLTRSWSNFNLNMRVSRFESYFAEDDFTAIRRNLPEIGFRTPWVRLFSPLFFFFSSKFHSWEDGTPSAYEEGKQKRSQSLILNPKFSIPFNKISWLNINTVFSPNFSYHFQSYAPKTRTPTNESLFAPTYTLDISLIGPVFNKVFYDAQNKPKFKHIIEPSFAYIYESPIADSNRIITPYDMVFGQHLLRYGLTNRVLQKKKDVIREVFVFGLNQMYFLDDDFNPMQIFPIEGKIPKFSDIYGFLRFYPEMKLSLDASAGFNPNFMTLTNIRLGARLNPSESLFLRVNWFKSVNPYTKKARYNRHQINIYGGLKIPRISLEAMAEIDFNIQEKEMLYSAFSLIYHYQCLDFKADLRIFYYREKPEPQFRISIGLGNIGKTTDFLGGMGF